MIDIHPVYIKGVNASVEKCFCSGLAVKIIKVIIIIKKQKWHTSSTQTRDDAPRQRSRGLSLRRHDLAATV